MIQLADAEKHMMNKKLQIFHRLNRRESKNLAYTIFFYVTDTQTSKQILDTTYVLQTHQFIITPYERQKAKQISKIPLAKHDCDGQSSKFVT